MATLTEKAVIEGFRLMEDELASIPSPKPSLDADRIARWLTFFGELSDEEFLKGATQAVLRLKFWPKPSEFAEALNGSNEVRSTDAWEQVRDALRRFGSYASLTASDIGGDGAALWCIARMGLEEIGMMDEGNRSIKAAEFRRLYATATERGYSLDRLPGKFELDNRAKAIDTSQDTALIGRPESGTLAIEARQNPALPERPATKEEREAVKAQLSEGAKQWLETATEGKDPQ